MELQKITTESQSVSTLQNQQIEFTKQLFHVNCLVAYPITDTMLEVWTNSINELAPEINSSIVKIIIDRMKLGSIPYDNRKGIQNIFAGYLVLMNDKIKALTEKMNKFNMYALSNEDQKVWDKLLSERKDLQLKSNKFIVASKPLQYY